MVMKVHIYNNWTQETTNTRGFVFAGLSYHEDYHTGYTEYSVCIALLGFQIVISRCQYYT